MPKVIAVIVTHGPCKNSLSRLLLALRPQITQGIVINNGHVLPLTDAELWQAGYAVQHLQSNRGVAAALNLGFFWAESQDAEFVITFDQDSQPAHDMVSRLLIAYQIQLKSGCQVGALGPQQIDSRSGRLAPFIKPITWWRCSVVPAADQSVEVDHLITSGCLVPIAAWRDAGSFLEELFIDYVDIEWSLRLRHRGWRLIGVGGSMLTHSIGDKIQTSFGLQIPWHSPLRHYFMFRNGLHLQKLPHVSLSWKVVDATYLIMRLVLFVFLARSNLTHSKAILRGVCDGLAGRLGPPK